MTLAEEPFTNSDGITPYQADALREFLSMGVGKAASSINTMLGKHIDLGIPTIEVLDALEHDTVPDHDNVDCSIVTLGFNGNINGNASVIFDLQSAKELISALTPRDTLNQIEMYEMAESIIGEIGNIVVNEVIGTLANIFEFKLTYQVPRYSESSLKAFYESKLRTESMQIIFAEKFMIVDVTPIKGRLVIFYALDEIKNLLNTCGLPPYAESSAA